MKSPSVAPPPGVTILPGRFDSENSLPQPADGIGAVTFRSLTSFRPMLQRRKVSRSTQDIAKRASPSPPTRQVDIHFGCCKRYPAQACAIETRRVLLHSLLILRVYDIDVR